MSTAIANIPLTDIRTMAGAFVKSRLFGMKNEEEALALMLIAQAENIHPALAARDYHIIQGKPALKADAMLSRFQQAGGKVQWNDLTDELVSATFSHPSGGSVKISWGKKDAERAGFWGKDNWKKFPRAMLRSRVVSEGIRTVFPGIVVGVYTPEEVQDFDGPVTQQPTQEAARPIIDVTPEDKPSTNDRTRQAVLIRAIEGCKTTQDLTLWASSHTDEIDALPEMLRDTVNEAIDMRFKQIENGVHPETFKWVNVAEQDAWMPAAKECIDRCDTLEELALWEEGTDADGISRKRKLADLTPKRREHMREYIGDRMTAITDASKQLQAAG